MDNQVASIRQPKQLYLLFFAEMWERFSFYGMKALLIAYMVSQLHFDDPKAYAILGSYAALVYTMPMFGGFMADKFIGYQRSVMFGGIMMTLGHFILALPNDWSFFYGMAFIICGNGFFKPNISSLVGTLYEENDPRRDSGFSIFYMGINIGAAIGGFLCAYVGTEINWHYGFGLAGIFMAITVFAIDEKKYCVSKPHSVPMKMALKQTLTNKRFLLFIVADFSYFIAVTIITSGLLYFVTVLLQLPETLGNKLMITMVLVSFIFYPVVNYFSKKIGKKIIVIVSFALLSLVFLGIYFLGKGNVNAELQIYSLIILAAIPLASLNILPNAILAEIIEKDTIDTQTNKEGIYFAVRYFFVKIAQTFGIALFAMFLLYGKDVGNDYGIRLSGLLGFVLCLLAAIIFTRFKEKR